MKRFIGTVHLYYKGKCYGATTRQVNANSLSSARNKLKKNFHYPGNKVKVTHLRAWKKKKRR